MSTPLKAPPRNVSPNRLLYTLMVTAIIMPLSGWMFSLSLPIIRDDLGITADVAAWVATAFSLPFMIFMPVYGRLSDGLGKRRLLLGGIATFALGSLIATFSVSMTMLVVGRAIQGIGAAGLVPLSLALIAEVFAPDSRGQAMGLWSTVGPLTGVMGPLVAGFVVASWGWRASFVPPILFAIIGIGAIMLMIPSSGRRIQPTFLTSFDWIGVGLLAATLTLLLFYLASRPITGVAPLQDWRLGLGMILMGAAFVWHENRRDDPFIRLPILRNRSLVFASICACLRMICLSGGFGFLMPLYLADVFDLGPSRSGIFLMLNPLMMTLVVRLAGRFSDRWGSRWLVMAGFSIIAADMLVLTRLVGAQDTAWLIAVFLTFGFAAGLMLATLHRAALNEVPETDMGTASGVYSMVRFLGSASGAAIGGILLQGYLDITTLTELAAYQSVFYWFAGVALLGLAAASFLPKGE